MGKALLLLPSLSNTSYSKKTLIAERENKHGIIPKPTASAAGDAVLERPLIQLLCPPASHNMENRFRMKMQFRLTVSGRGAGL